MEKQTLLKACEQVKIEMVTKQNAELKLDHHQDANCSRLKIDRHIFDALLSPLYEEFDQAIEKILHQVNLTIADVSTVLLVDEFSLLPSLRNHIQ